MFEVKGLSLTGQVIAERDARQEALIDQRANELAMQADAEMHRDLLEEAIATRAAELRDIMIERQHRYVRRGSAGSRIGRLFGKGRDEPEFVAKTEPKPGFSRQRPKDLVWQTPLLSVDNTETVSSPETDDVFMAKHGIIFELRCDLPQRRYFYGAPPHDQFWADYTKSPVVIYDALQPGEAESRLAKVFEVNPDQRSPVVDHGRLDVVNAQVEAEINCEFPRIEFGSVLRDHFRQKRLEARHDEYCGYTHVKAFSDDGQDQDYPLLFNSDAREQVLGLLNSAIVELR